MDFDIRIPFAPNGQLGRCYNRIMEESKNEWVLFIDDDVFLRTNPHWYHITSQCLDRYHKKIGILTCYTNNIVNKAQRLDNAPDNKQPIEKHIDFAKKIFDKNQYNCTVIDKESMSGFFLLTSKTAWEKAGGFLGEGMFKEDNIYHKRIKEAGYNCYRMDGLYLLHLRDRERDTWIKGQKTSKQIWNEWKGIK